MLTIHSMTTQKTEHKICRLCLGYPLVFYSLGEQNITFMLKTLTGLDVSDEIVAVCCTKCYLNLKLAFEIQQHIIKANEEFLTLDLNEVLKIKTEKNFDPTPTTSYTTDNNDPADDNLPLAEVYIKPEPVYPKVAVSSSCLICGERMPKDEYNAHIRQHYNRPQTCEFCAKNFENMSTYKQHINRAHSEQKLVNHSCGTCGVTFRYVSLFNIHLDLAHKAAAAKPKSLQDLLDKYEAQRARKGWPTLVRKRVARRARRADQKVYKCDQCDKVFDSQRQFTAHTHERKECPKCKRMVTKNNFSKHYYSHFEQPLICEICGNTLKNKESLRGHMLQSHNVKRFKCEQCGKVFQKHYTLTLHLKKHAGDKGHICETCGKAFYTFYNLNQHIKRTHLKMRKYTCEFCDKRFASRFGLMTHRRQHTNETPYRCEICGEGFRQNVSLRGHRKSKHNIIEPKTIACTVCGKMFGCEQAIISHMRLH